MGETTITHSNLTSIERMIIYHKNNYSLVLNSALWLNLLIKFL